MDRAALQASADYAQACTGCADACLSEDTVAEMATCIRTDQNCADIRMSLAASIDIPPW